MSDDREFLRATTDWLEAGSDRTPPAAVDAVLLAVRTTRQDRVLPNPWRHIDMSALSKALVAATAVVVIALALFHFGPTSNGVGVPAAPTPTPRPTATPSPTPAPTPQLLSENGGPLEPGRRYAFPSLATNPVISMTVPSGWSGSSTAVAKDYGDNGPVGPLVFAWPFDHGFKNPCTDHTPVSPAAGSGAAGLLAVIAGQPGLQAGPVTDVTVGGHAGKYVDYTVTADAAACTPDSAGGGFWIWGNCPPPATAGCEMIGVGDRRYGVSKNDRERAYAIDVDGTIVTFFGTQPADLLAADRPELQQVLDSMEFGPAS